MDCHYNRVLNSHSFGLVSAKISRAKKEMLNDKTHAFPSKGLELHRSFKGNF